MSTHNLQQTTGDSEATSLTGFESLLERLLQGAPLDAESEDHRCRLGLHVYRLLSVELDESRSYGHSQEDSDLKGDILRLAELLFLKEKPLKCAVDSAELSSLLDNDDVKTALKEACHRIIRGSRRLTMKGLIPAMFAKCRNGLLGQHQLSEAFKNLRHEQTQAVPKNVEQALISAARAGKLFELRVILRHGHVDVNAFEPSDGMTALHCAAIKGHWGCVALLLKHGANVDVMSSHPKNDALQSLTALDHLLQHFPNTDKVNAQKCIQLLVECGARVDDGHLVDKAYPSGAISAYEEALQLYSQTQVASV